MMMSMFSLILNHPWTFGLIFRAMPLKAQQKAGTYCEHDAPMQEAFRVEALFEDADADADDAGDEAARG